MPYDDFLNDCQDKLAEFSVSELCYDICCEVCCEILRR